MGVVIIVCRLFFGVCCVVRAACSLVGVCCLLFCVKWLVSVGCSVLRVVCCAVCGVGCLLSIVLFAVLFVDCRCLVFGDCCQLCGCRGGMVLGCGLLLGVCCIPFNVC